MSDVITLTANETTCRTKTGTQIHVCHVSGQGRTHCGCKIARTVSPDTLTKFAQVCDKCVPQVAK